MGGCHSYTSTTDAKSAPPTSQADFSDISGHKLKNNNSKVAPSLEEKPYLLNDYVSEHIGHMDMRMLSALPMGFDRAEWIASNTVAFFKNISLLCGALSEYCTCKTCPTINGPGNMVYSWMDEHGRKVKCSAPLYTDYALSYIQELLTDEAVFPTRTGTPFPNGYTFMVQKVFLFLFRTLAHLYWVHFRDVVRLDMHPHLNTLLIHLVTFSREFGLLEPAETAPLDDLISALMEFNGV
ncbi:MOB kinase activator 2-like [Brienomyrus brachyistius]|uniref:MOB kinase activator 2-like n=1 Tax=Brienomyrus brachyistius TaxID=42636 RepID=UPI0020B4164A|nr:MOB kinase activator 2-like [Brienomyrus brachyistius]